MKLPKKWWVSDYIYTSNPFMKKIYDDQTHSTQEPVYLVPAEKLEALAELVKRDPMQMSDDQVFDFANDLKKAIEQLGEGDE